MKKHHCTLGILLALRLAQPAGAAAEFPVRVHDDRGRVVVFARSPQRIVSLMPSLTESVCALEACARLVGIDRYSNWPSEVGGLPKLGGLEDAAIESIAALHPDVVLAARSSRVIERLEELRIPVVALEPTSLAGMHHVLIEVARMLGSPLAAAELWRRIETLLATASARVPAELRGKRVYFEVSDAPYAASGSSFIGEVLRLLRLDNAVPGELGPFPKLNPEFVVRAQPDLIMASAEELSGMPSRPGWDRLTALRNRRTCAFAESEMDILVRPGPRLGMAAGLIANCLRQLSETKSP